MSKDHFVPQLILKRFKKPGGVFWYYDRQRPQKGVEERNPSKVFYHRSFSTSSDKEFSVEEQFQERIETPLTELLDKVLPMVRLGFTPEISDENAELVAHFLYYQAKRRPEVVRDTLDTKIYGPLTFRDRAEERAVKFTSSVLDSNLSEDLSFIHDLRLHILTHTNPKVIRHIIDTGFWFARAPAQGAFCITSNPIRSHFLDIVDASGVRRSGQSLLIPVAHDIAVCFGPPWLDRTVQFINDPQCVDRINESLWAQSNKIGGPTKQQIEQIVGIRT
nr:DUF4238 domain-containing protein [uncultured Hyphomonas sp.]